MTKDTNTQPTFELTGRLEMRLREDVETKLLKMVHKTGRSKTEVVNNCILKKALRYHLDKEEREIYRMFAEAKGDFQAIKNALNARTQTERLRLFKNDAFMQEWLATVNLCIDQWGRIINKLNDRS